MVTNTRLLDGLLDNLDDLFDGNCLPEDTAALVMATLAAMPGSPWVPLLRRTCEALEGIREDDAYERVTVALGVTADLRTALAAGFDVGYPWRPNEPDAPA